MSLASAFDALAAQTPEAPAVELPARRIAYADLAASSLLAARRMRAAGVGRGDRVAILLAEVDEDYLAAVYGAARLGAIVVPVNSRYRAHELEHVARDADPALLITSSRFAPLVSALPLSSGSRVVDLEDAVDFHRGEARVSADEVREQQQRLAGSDPARIIYTSGTTASPRGCLHTHAALLAQGEAVAARLELDSAERFWTPLPMFHVAGWSTMLAAHARGACFNHVGVFDPGVALEQIVAQRCTVLFPGFETLWMAVLDHPRFRASDLGAARLVINVGVPERMRLMQERLPDVPQVSNTGSTEACGFLAIGSAGDPLEARLGTAGRELEGMEVRIVAPTGEEVGDGEAGEMIFRGIWRMRDYYGDEPGTREAIDDEGWFHSGDLVRRDAGGRLVFLSRLKDMLKVGGENVAAAEIEGLLLTHPAIHVAHVVAAPDARYGEVPAAFVELRPGTELSEGELIDFCLGRIATFKVPRYMRTVTEWPMSGTKVRKVALRERIAEELARAGIEQAPKLTDRSAAASR